jgi:hypothetical protein
MSQIIHLRKWSVHCPSVARARILPTFFLRRPLIYIQGHNGRDLEVVYMPREWDKAQQDFEKLQQSIQACQKALEAVPTIQAMPRDLKRMQ